MAPVLMTSVLTPHETCPPISSYQAAKAHQAQASLMKFIGTTVAHLLVHVQLTVQGQTKGSGYNRLRFSWRKTRQSGPGPGTSSTAEGSRGSMVPSRCTHIDRIQSSGHIAMQNTGSVPWYTEGAAAEGSIWANRPIELSFEFVLWGMLSSCGKDEPQKYKSGKPGIRFDQNWSLTSPVGKKM
jgi:hypothetical protein